jgi:iron complex transport system ATP-binding protein
MLELRDIYFSYNPDNDKRFNLEQVNINIDAGEFVGIFGPNGSGKSTLLKILSGLLKPKSGNVLLDGEELSKLKRKSIAAKIAFVPQATASIFPYTVYEIVAMGRTPHLGIMGFESGEDNNKILEAINVLELIPVMNKGINEISGGEAQRAYIARAIAQDPDIILLDEPNSHLDLKHQVSIYKLLQKLNKELNLTIVSVSHDLNLSAHFCRRGILLSNGRVVQDGLIHDILTEENIKSVFEIDSKVDINVNEELTVILRP